MLRIVHAFLTLEQHLRAIVTTPQSYHPGRCPHCGRACLWAHGFYERKADRSRGGTLNSVPVPRYCCTACRRTCSRLPLCICPLRWYGWALQQLVLTLILFGVSLRRVAAVVGVDRRTVRRWWCWLVRHSDDFAFVLRSRFPELGRAADTISFWRTCFALMPLSRAMAWLDLDGLDVP
ncbi:DUF6431 domain-containing protein [Burkholderia ubonensis]|uniref:DUF6431 domain-containing protein n=2 Tax=Burkholderia ubonensis TaxID=101571 RepID=A0AA40R9C0_9BURK|nr:DUF6431 domain-containing protein [Burkholderia ubonensis]KVZ42219.1 hypothetical protein WL16_26985 [Burkholderia ubonensis]KWZ58290.1 hypothetical protein WK57_17280 [Burkholderia ubonensis]KWZ58353.1 hypothetical protein WK57_17755 [Burkholderia ubonensis]KWZ58435.1 hypothetical protein WK57_18315 [Burkholderia ubonensis]KWZ58525.1 hypothetical protein WK57_18945 [Burkholderia ubonensis]